MNLTFMVNYTCRYIRDTTLNICKCPSKDLSMAKQLFFQLAYIRCLLYCVMCVSMIMFVYDYTYLHSLVYTYITIIHNTFMLLKYISTNQIKSTHCTVISDGIHDTQSMNYMYSLQQNIKQRERDIYNTEQSE